MTTTHAALAETRWGQPADLEVASPEDFLLPDTSAGRLLLGMPFFRLVCRRLRLQHICACLTPQPLPLGDDSPAGPSGGALKPETGGVGSKQQLLYEAEAAACPMWRSDGGKQRFFYWPVGQNISRSPGKGGFSVVCGGGAKTAEGFDDLVLQNKTFFCCEITSEC